MPELLFEATKEREAKRRVAIVIPTYNNLEYLKQTINSIFLTTNYPLYRIIIVESESTDGTKEWLKQLREEYPDRIEIFHTKKEGSIKAVNFGIQQTKNEDIYLTQDDVIFYSYRDWLWDYADFAERSEIGMISSCAVGVSGSDYLNGLGWVGTWDCYIPRRTINQIGIFDDTYEIGEDIDYAYRVVKSGLKILNFQDFRTIFHHQKRKTQHADQSEEVKKRNAEKFRRKHNLWKKD